MSPNVQPFSSGYYILDDTRVVPYNGSKVIVTEEYLMELTQHVATPILKIGGTHKYPHAEQSMLHDAVAVPDSLDYQEDAPLLLAKDEKAVDLVLSGSDGPT